MKYTSKTTVSESNTAIAMGSGDLMVFATPSMCALMENAAMNAAALYLKEKGEPGTTVGISLNISHVKASPVGRNIEAEAELTGVEGRKLTFKVSAYERPGDTLIGEGTHQRFVVDAEKFMAKLK